MHGVLGFEVLHLRLELRVQSLKKGFEGLGLYGLELEVFESGLVVQFRV